MRLSKKRNIPNTFYEEGYLSDKERKRIKTDYASWRVVEEEVVDRLLKEKENITRFNPAIYEIDSYMKKYDRPEISNVFGLLNHQADVDDAMQRYAERGFRKSHFYVGNMEHDSFEDEMDKILSEYSLCSFDMVDLTDIHFEVRQISTIGLKCREQRRLFETLFSYVEREYQVMHEKGPTTYSERHRVVP